MKKANKKNDDKSASIDKDFSALCKKHKLEKAALIVEKKDGQDSLAMLVSSHISGGRGEKTMTMAILHLLKKTGGLNSKNIKHVIQLIEELEVLNATETVLKTTNSMMEKKHLLKLMMHQR